MRRGLEVTSKRPKIHSQRGQAMLEYVLSLAAMLAVVAVMGYVVAAAVKSADRTNALVRADCP